MGDLSVNHETGKAHLSIEIPASTAKHIENYADALGKDLDQQVSDMLSSATLLTPVAFQLMVPYQVFSALEWYVKHTHYWIGNDEKNRALNSFIVDIIKAYLRMEAENPIDARDWVKDIMQSELVTF